jgi:hypothetical protein
MIRHAFALAPHFSAIHPLSATGPEECIFLFQNTFMSVVFDAYSEVPDYIAWLLHQDLTPDYRPTVCLSRDSSSYCHINRFR